MNVNHIIQIQFRLKPLKAESINGKTEVKENIADQKNNSKPTTSLAAFFRVFRLGFCVSSDIGKELLTRWRAVIV